MPLPLRLAVPLVALCLGCRGTEPVKTDPALPPSPRKPLLVEPASYDFGRSPGLLGRVTASPHGYYRLINLQFANLVCERFAADIAHMPSVNLHGDAHLEQYAITDLGRGLTDFDDSATGPAVLDLVRFGTSLELAARSKGWKEHSDRLFAEFMRGYRSSMNDPELTPEPPPIVARVESEFHRGKLELFRFVESILDPTPEPLRSEIEAALKPYVEAMKEADPSLDARYFEVQQIGRPRIGIGSALDRKFLIRVRGATDEPEDDDILELKEVRDLSGIRCMEGQRRAPLRTLVAEVRIAYEPSRLLGYVRLQEDYFWVHAWVANYRELDVETVFATPDEIAAIAYDVGVQLGRGHPRDIASPFGVQLRRETIAFLDKRERTIREACVMLADEVEEAWMEFKRLAAK